MLLGPDGTLPACSIVGAGPIPNRIYAMGLDSQNRLFLTDSDGAESRLLRVDIATSTSSIVSGCSVDPSVTVGQVCGGPIVGTGAMGTLLGGIVQVPQGSAMGSGLVPGEVIVALSRSEACPNPPNYAVVRIDPLTGDRVTLSGLDGDCTTVVGAGDSFVEPNGLLLLANGVLLVADGDSGIGRLISVDPASGNRTVVSGCSATLGNSCIGPVVGSGPSPDFVRDLVRTDGSPSRVLALASFPLYCGAGEQGGLVVFDLQSGDRTVLSGRDDACILHGAGPPFNDLEAVTRGPGGTLLVSEDSSARILAVDPISGERRVVSGCGGFTPSGQCVEPILGAGPIPDSHGPLVALPEPAPEILALLGALFVTLLNRRSASSRADRRNTPA